MTILTACIILFILCLGFIGFSGKTARLIAAIIVGTIIAGQAGFRDWLHMENDTPAYYLSYCQVSCMSWRQLASDVEVDGKKYEKRDKAFLLFMKFSQAISPHFRFLLILVAMMVAVPVSWILYRLSLSPSGVFLAGMFFEVLFAGFFMTAMRQAVAMSIAMISLWPLMHKRYLIHYILLIFACSIHIVVAVMLPLAVLMMARNQRALLIASICLVPLIMEVAKPVLAHFAEGTLMEGYVINTRDNLGTPVFSFLLIAMSVCFAIRFGKISKAYQEGSNNLALPLLASAVSLSCILMPESWVDSNFIRAAFCTLIIGMLVPSAIIDTSRYRRSFYVMAGMAFLFLAYK